MNGKAVHIGGQVFGHCTAGPAKIIASFQDRTDVLELNFTFSGWVSLLGNWNMALIRKFIWWVLAGVLRRL